MAKNRMGLRVHIERCRTAIALIASTVVLSGFSNRDLQAYHAPRDTYLECVQRMNLVRHLRNDRGVFDFERNFAESPSITFYHWEDYPTVTREVERNGFAESDLHGILRQWAGSGIGLFLSSDPQSSSAHGEIMMAVDVYAPSYPGSAAAVEDTNHPHWLPTDGAMIRDNVFDYYLKKPAHPLESQIAYPGWWYVQDLRVIKQLRWPSKNMVDSLWLRRPLSSAMLRNRYQRHHIKAGAQWMIAPNYSTEERWVRWVSTAAESSLYINFVLLNPIPMSLRSKPRKSHRLPGDPQSAITRNDFCRSCVRKLRG